MITWMQKHKKYLVVTIWVSTIAFVGAGFVGWGSYNFNDSSSIAAKVGEKEIKLSELQQEYSSLYNQYNQMFGGNLTQEQANQFGLDKLALNNVIQKYNILNYSDEIELKSLDLEVAKEIAKQEAFQKDGKFDKEQYLSILNRANLSISDFEHGVKNDITTQKVVSIFETKASALEKELIASLTLMKDRVSIEVIDSNNFEINLNDEDIQSFWKKNKNNYLSKKEFELNTIFIESDNSMLEESELKKFYEKNRTDFKGEDDKILSFEDAKNDVNKLLKLKQAKKIALKQYVQFKKDKIESTNKLKVSIDNLDYNENNKNIIDSKKGSVLKPFKYKNGYLIVKINNIIEPKPLPFEIARNDAKIDLEKKTKEDKLVKLAKLKVKNFNGVEIGFVSRFEPAPSIDNLTNSEVSQLISKIFENTKSQVDYAMIGSKAIVYKILEQKLATKEEIENIPEIKSLYDNIDSVKNSVVINGFIKNIENRYRVESSMLEESE